MSRNKLLTIRIEEEKRLAFNNWCEARDYSYSKFLYKVIESCLSGRIDESIFSGEPVDNDLAVCLSERMKHIEQLLSDRSINLKVDDSVDEYLGNNLDKRIEESVIKKLDNNLDSKLNKAISASCHSVIADKIQSSECELSEYLDNKMNTAIALLKEEISPILESQQEIEKLSQDNEFINAIATEVKK